MVNQYVTHSARFSDIYNTEPTPSNGDVIGVVENGNVTLKVSDGDVWFDVPNGGRSAITLFGATFVQSTTPSDVAERKIWYDTSQNSTKVYYNGSFMQVV